MRGVEQFQIIAPPEAKPLLREAARLMMREKDPLDPRAALRRAGGGNEPDITEEPADLLAELEEARNRAAKAEADFEAHTKSKEAALQAELAVAKAAEAARREEAQGATKAAQEAKEQATEAIGRAEKAEAAIRQAKALPGIKGRLVRWLAGDVLPD